MDYVTLLGSEDVQRAGRNISSAAGDIQSAANSMADAQYRQQQYMEEWIGRFEVAVEKLVEKENTGWFTNMKAAFTRWWSKS